MTDTAANVDVRAQASAWRKQETTERAVRRAAIRERERQAAGKAGLAQPNALRRGLGE
jgi:hypothetical protein